MKKFIFVIFISNFLFSLTPDEAFKILEKSAIASKPVGQLKAVQKVATLLTCSDMEIKINDVFKLPKEKIYSVNVLGNVALEPEIASIEYSLIQLQSPLVVVIGHYNCHIINDAIKGNVKSDSINAIVENLNTSIERAGMIYGTNFSEILYKQSIILNVYNSMENLLKKSRIIKDLINMQKLKIVGAIYNEKKGSIEWLGEHPMQKEIMQGTYNSLEFLAFYKEKQSQKTPIKTTTIVNSNIKSISVEKKQLKKVTIEKPKEEKKKNTTVSFIMSKNTASPRKPVYITIRVSTAIDATEAELTIYAVNLSTGEKSIVFRLPELKIVNGIAQAQFYFAGRKFKKNLYLKKGNYRITANIKTFKNKKLIENRTYPSKNKENVITLY